MNLKEKQLNAEYIYKGKIINVRKDTAEIPNGTTAIREVVEHNGGVCVCALTDKNEIIFVKQFRYPYMEEILEIPAGKLDYVGEDPVAAALRELSEETGATCKSLRFIGNYLGSPALLDENIWMYLANSSVQLGALWKT